MGWILSCGSKDEEKGIKKMEWYSIMPPGLSFPGHPLYRSAFRSCPTAATATALNDLPPLLHFCSCPVVIALWQRGSAVDGCIYWPYVIPVLEKIFLGSLQTLCSSCTLLERRAGAALLTRLQLYACSELLLQPVHKVIPKTISAILGTIKPASIGQKISHQLDLPDFGPNELFLDSACAMRVCVFDAYGIKFFKIPSHSFPLYHC